MLSSDLLILRPSDPGTDGAVGQQGLRLDEDVAVQAVEPADDLPRELEVRDLVLADGDELALARS